MIVGAGGGIGAALCRNLAEQDAGARLFGTVRSAQQTIPGVVTTDLDIVSQASIDRFSAWCMEHLPRIDRLVFATGALHIGERTPEKALQDVTLARLNDAYRINAAGPLAVSAGLQDLLRGSQAARVVFLSAQIGSIGDNQLGGWYGYRMAKAALNMGVKTLAIETERWKQPPIVAAVHPGTTVTNLSARFVARRKGVASPEEAAARLRRFIDALEPDMSGGLFKTDGARLPW